MVVTQELMRDLLECLEAAVHHADAGQVPQGRTLEEMRSTLRKARNRVGGRA